MAVLSCAEVGIHGRDTRARTCGLTTIGLLCCCAPIGAQPSSAFLDLTTELAAKIAAAIPPGSQVALIQAPAPNDASIRDVDREIARLLASRGLRVVSSAGSAIPVVVAGCGANLRERACVAEIRRGDSRDFVSSVRPHGVRLPGRDASTDTVAIEAVPLFGQRARILDVLVDNDRLVVLDPAGVAAYRRASGDWQPLGSRAIAPVRIWPRDLRGRLRVNGGTLEAFLPGLVCRAPVEASSLTCTEQREPWPLAIDNAGLDALRNTFHTPEGMPFLSAAPLDPEAGARAVAVDLNRNVVLMDESRTAVATIGTADDVASLVAPCRGKTYVLTSAATAGAQTDTLHLWRVAERRALAAATPIALPGRVTALWASPGASIATAVVRDAGADRHEAFQIRLSCDR